MAIVHAYKGAKTKVVVDASEPVMTKQSFKQEVDMNNIIARHVKRGGVPPLPPDLSFGFAPPYSFHEAMNLIREADNYFDQVPSELRNRFRNDPGLFIDFIENPDNRDELMDMGLIDRPVEVEEPPIVAATVEPPVDPVA